MRQQRPITTSSSLFSMATQTAKIQIVATSRGLLLDVQASWFDTTGHARVGHATTMSCLDQAMRLETLLQEALSAAWDIDEDGPTERSDPRQACLWSPATATERARRRAA